MSSEHVLDDVVVLFVYRRSLLVVLGGSGCGSCCWVSDVVSSVIIEWYCSYCLVLCYCLFMCFVIWMV